MCACMGQRTKFKSIKFNENAYVIPNIKLVGFIITFPHYFPKCYNRTKITQ